MMSDAIVMALAPVFFVLLLGYLAGKFDIVDNRRVDSLNALVMDFALPASLFAAIASASRRQMIEQAPLFLAFGLTTVVLYAGWYFAVRAVSRVSRSDASLQALTIGFPNLAGVGLPIAASVLGPAGTIPIAVALAAGSILVSPLTLIIVEMGNGGERGAKLSWAQALSAIRRALTKPIVVAPVLGLLLSILDLDIGALAQACLSLIGSTAAGVALFLTGLILSAQSFRLEWKAIAATAASDVIRPLLAGAIVYGSPIAPETAKTVILLAAMPPGFFGILFAVNYRLDSSTVGSMVTASTLFSIATMAIVIAFLFPH